MNRQLPLTGNSAMIRVPMPMLLGVVGPVVLGQHVVAEIVRRVPPRRMDVGAVSLRVVVLDEQGRALHPVVVPVAG